MTVPEDVYRRGCVTSAEEGVQAAQRIGFPVMIKASEGGGGKGIRKSTNAEDFPNLFRQVRNSTWRIVCHAGCFQKLRVFLHPLIGSCCRCRRRCPGPRSS